MKRHVLTIALGLLFPAVAMSANPGGASGANEPQLTTQTQTSALGESPSDPALVAEVSRLVEASLEALRDGRDHRYETFLKESLARFPGFAPARWHSGYVQMGGAWVHVEEVPYRAGEIAALVKYAELREKADERHFTKQTTKETSRTRLVNREQTVRQIKTTVPGPIGNGSTRPREVTRTGTLREQLDTYARERVRMINTAGYSRGYARAQESLARWCSQNGLPEEARIHWAQVLKQEPANRDAIQALGLTEYGGRLWTAEQISRIRLLEKDAERSMKTWKEPILALQREAASTDTNRRKASIDGLSAIRDPNAVFALEAITLWQSSARGPRARILEPFHRAVVSLIAVFDTQPATESLVRFAVMHQLESIRQLAAQALHSREPREYAPVLLGALTMPIQYDLSLSYDELGRQHVHADARQEHQTHIVGVRDSREVYNVWHLRSLSASAIAGVSEVAKFNEQADELNRRIMAALQNSVGVDGNGPFAELAGASARQQPKPSRWWEWWYDFNEQYVSKEKPYYGYDYGWNAYDNHQITYTPSMSCFVKGTPVWTLSGPKPIEQIKIGDRVLAQHPETGELSYKGVLMTTLRPASEMLTIRVGKSTITTTLGHPFFVVGKGWRMAKQLTEADWIYAQGQTVPIDSIAKAEPAEAHNLVVADFGTYFVGKDRILVHDNSPIPPVRLEMPGLLAVR
jgi:hypothetical protein